MAKLDLNKQKREHPKLRELKFTLTRIFKNPSAIIGFSLILFFSGVAIFAPNIAPPKGHNKYMIPHKGYSTTPKPPSATNILGTTSGQYDIFYGVVWGTRTAFRIGFFVVVISAIVGVFLGLVSGYYGGIIDEIIMRFVDIVFAVPLLVLVMSIVISLGTKFDNKLDAAMFALCLVVWRRYVRVMRSGILTIREQDFVQAAKVMGVSDIKIMIRHILPNSIYPVMVIAFMDMGSMVITAAFLSFIGLGAPIGYADWGQMVASARDYIIGPVDDPLKYWYAIFFPGSCIITFCLGWNLIGDALRDAFDPKVRRK